ELPRQVEVVVLREVDRFRRGLAQQQIDLPYERAVVADPVEVDQLQAFCRKVLAKQIRVLRWAAVQQRPELYSQITQRLPERSQTQLGQLVLVVCEDRRPLRYARVDPVGYRQVETADSHR